MTSGPESFDPDRAAALLGVTPSATEQQLRAAYLLKVQQHPPDRDPDLFEQVRDAYEQLRRPEIRARAVMGGPSPDAPLVTLLDGLKSTRAHIGSQLWIELLRERRS